jgi:NAD(P)H dehydrogenase (quinone)
MNNILILFDTKTGHTKTMAELVRDGAAAVPATEVRLRPVAEATAADLVWCDGLAVGSPTHVGLVSTAMKSFWDRVCPEVWGKIDGRIGCAFASAGGRGGGAELVCQSILTILLNYGCLVFGVTEYTGPGQTLHYGAVAVGEPQPGNESEACRLLGRRLAEWTSRYRHGGTPNQP